jgi:hypothetical protein
MGIGKQIRILFAACASGLLVLGGCVRTDAVDPAPAVKAQVIKTPELMVHVIEPAARNFWKGYAEVLDKQGWRDVSPQTEVEWKVVEDGATTVLAGVTVLQQDAYAHEPAGRWNAFTQKVVDLMQAGREGAERQDKQAMLALGEQLDEACDACHAEFAPRVQ